MHTHCRRSSCGRTRQPRGICAVDRKFALFDFVQIAASGSASGEDACVRALARIHCEHEAKHDDSHGGSHQNRHGEAGFAEEDVLQRLSIQIYLEEHVHRTRCDHRSAGLVRTAHYPCTHSEQASALTEIPFLYLTTQLDGSCGNIEPYVSIIT